MSALYDASRDEPVSSAEERLQATRRLGSFLVLFVVCLYVGSSVMIQMLFDEMQYEKPCATCENDYCAAAV